MQGGVGPGGVVGIQMRWPITMKLGSKPGLALRMAWTVVLKRKAIWFSVSPATTV